MVAQIDRQYVRYGAKKTLRRIISYVLFEGRPHTTRGQWFNSVIFLLLRSLNAIPGTPELQKPVFITGLGRSGTTILGLLLSLHRDVGFLNEPKIIWRLIDQQHDINGDYVPSGGVFRLGGEDVTPLARRTARRLFSRYLCTVRATRLVDKYPELIFRVDYLLEVFPDARIVFIMRNGCDACQSIARWSNSHQIHHNNILEDWWGRNNIKWYYLYSQFIQKDMAFEKLRHLPADAYDQTNRAAIEWIITMREGYSQMLARPDSIIPIRYEDLTNNPEAELTRLQGACDLEPDPGVMDYAKNVLYPNEPKPFPDLHPVIDAMFTETMDMLGYSQKPVDL